ncbi:ATP-binding protein [Adhaeribacter aquaticus]|uniref:ATP-binding protein n=1 Tax=Adhaeribacter aquaticus TaxID=299567 RepID=UPI0003F76C17|nr:ATP-binding protein [Adhaeribacter aquaticus]
MKIEEIEIKNFKAISELGLEIKGNNVYVLGGNGKGKTSFIDAIFKILTGKDLPPKLVKAGEKNGEVRIDMGEYIVRAIFNAKTEKLNLSVESPEGAQYKSPRTMLDQIVKVIDFDINQFFSLSPKKQVEQIKTLVGIDFSDLDEQYAELYQERTFVNRKVKEVEAQTVTYDKSKTEKIDVNALVAELNKANEFNHTIDGAASRLNERTQKITYNEARIQQLMKEVDALQAETDQFKTQNQQASAWLGANTKIDTTAIQAKFDSAAEHNAQVDHTLAAIKKYEELEALIKQQEHLNKRIADIQEAKKQAIAESQMPVEGLTFDDDQLYLNGLPFERSQINTATAIITGLKIQMALLGEVRIARFDGSLLDNTSLAEVEAWAAANNLQLFVEMVDRSSEALKIEVREPLQFEQLEAAA